MTRAIQFDDRRARTYRKRREVLAFRSNDSILFRKRWGEQDLRAEGWVVVPLSDTGEVTGDIYGCDSGVFAQTYEPSPSLRPNQYRKRETVRAYQPGESFQIDTVLPDGHREVAAARAESYDAWIVRSSTGEVYPVEDAEFCRTYVPVLARTGRYRVRTRDEHWAVDGTPKRILALDGGGVRGILTLGYLERIETLLRARHGGAEDFRLSHYFDLIAGTSTGAIIAACLAKGMEVKEVRTMYERLAGSVFRRSALRWGLVSARYGARRLKVHLHDVFQNNTMGSHALQTGLLVVAKRLDTGSTWPMANNPGNLFFTAGPNDKFLSNEDYLVREVVRASTAAPSFFAPEYIEISREKERPHGEFVDGGVSPHNNPALLALQLVAVRGFGARWPLDPDKLLLVSVGTGAAQPGISHSWFAGIHAVKALRSLMDDCAESVETMLQWFSRSPTARNIDAAMQDLDGDLLAERPLLHYLRYNVQLEGRWLKENLGVEFGPRKLRNLRKMDCPENMEELADLGAQAAARQIEDTHFPAGFDLGE
jgi:uncharacterized protein